MSSSILPARDFCGLAAFVKVRFLEWKLTRWTGVFVRLFFLFVLFVCFCADFLRYSEQTESRPGWRHMAKVKLGPTSTPVYPRP